ncbi:transcriptional regulator, AraC family [Piscinibacter sakaiensis]|uniref:Transcriptional regulator, AraC family n=1 Tax=Piscinibacter sakaiensis TaxID=1547922 RepID=A0A0K8P2W2_PISS1|nr:transcriptional regulator, AraC family [Piscinibacter sakaiensis]
MPDHPLDGPADRAEFRRLGTRAGVELYRASIVRHAFDAHRHDGFGLGCVTHGAQRFRYRGAEHLAPAGALVLMNPGELHTGRAADAAGWRYRMVYLEPAVLEAASGVRGWDFAAPVVQDPAAARRLLHWLDQLWRADAGLAADAALGELAALLRPLARTARAAAEGRRPPDPGETALARAVERMHAGLGEPLDLATLAAAAGLSPFHFQRRFKAAHGVTPHQMLMALRLAEAQRRLAAGQAPAEVAAEVGLADQAHLTRRFARMYGVTPARYQQQVGTRPRGRAAPTLRG